MRAIRIGLVGSGFVSGMHAEALARVPGAEVLAVASPTEGHARSFAEQHGIPHWFTDDAEMLEMDEIDMIVIGTPNCLHAQATVAAAKAGKHVLCEKPLCMNLAEADRMIDSCRSAGVKLMYAEDLCFAPKYVRLKQLVDEGALGRVHHLKHAEKHGGPESAWFFDAGRSGGGVAMDMGCHSIEFCRWMLGKPRVRQVYAEMNSHLHGDKGICEDECVIILNFEGGATAVIEVSWSTIGGMEDIAEVYGSEGVAHADLVTGNAIRTYSNRGYDYAVEGATSTKGWSFAMFDENWHYGYPQEMAHFVECVREDQQPLETGEDGRVVLEILLAAYHSAAEGRKIDIPFATDAARPIDLWRSS